MKLTLDQALALIRGAATAVGVVKGLIDAGHAPKLPTGVPLTHEDVDREYAEALAEVLAAGDEAQSRLNRPDRQVDTP